jgi:hypothetical protein
MIRNVLNYLGQKIGELELLDDTSEEVWQEKLSVYTRPPIVPTPREMIAGKLEEYQKKSDELIKYLLADNTLEGITTEQSDQMFDEFIDVLIRLRNGAFPTALYRLSQKTPSGFATQDRIDQWINKIREYL